MNKHLKNQKGLADIAIMGAVLAVFYLAGVLFVPHNKAEEDKVVKKAAVTTEQAAKAETK